MEYIELALFPLLACIIIASIHTWLGIQVVKRGVIFIDLALAQVAVMGGAIGLLLDIELGTIMSYTISIILTIVFSYLFAIIKDDNKNTPKEAYIGIVYAVTAALTILLLDRSPEGAEHLKSFLVGSILTVGKQEVFRAIVLYSIIAAFYYTLRKQVFKEPNVNRLGNGRQSTLMEFLFYFSFGIVVTLSVKMAGILLVFSFLIVPAISGFLFFNKLKAVLLFGWGVSVIASLMGISFSFLADFPTGASIVASFGVLLVVLKTVQFLRKNK